MKQKKLDKKLSLNKKTIASLNEAEMKHLNGGGPTGSSCWTSEALYVCH